MLSDNDLHAAAAVTFGFGYRKQGVTWRGACSGDAHRRRVVACSIWLQFCGAAMACDLSGFSANQLEYRLGKGCFVSALSPRFLSLCVPRPSLACKVFAYTHT